MKVNRHYCWIHLVLILCMSQAAHAEFDGMASPYKWMTAGGRYLESTSFFSLHGYVNAVYGSFSRDWTVADPARVPGPGQLLVPNSRNSGTQYDAALIFGSEISPISRFMLEMHLVSDPSGTGKAGPGGHTSAITEATVSLDLHPEYLTMSAGLFWAPFGIANTDWLGAQNLFSLIPRASGAFPAHYNERGIRFDGAKSFSDKFGVNYVLSVGNGVRTTALSGQDPADNNEDKTVMARIGIFPGLGKKLETGISFAQGRLREAEDTSKALSDASRYPAKFSAVGLDGVYESGRTKLRGYYMHSKEQLGADAVGGLNGADLARDGFMMEGSYSVPVSNPLFPELTLSPKLRFDWAQVDSLNAAGGDAGKSPVAVYSAGLTIMPHKNYQMSLEYHLQDELGRTELADNRFVVKITGQF